MDGFVALGDARLRQMTGESASEDLPSGEFRDLDGKVYHGWLLGDGQGGFDDCWWIAVHDLKCVFQFFPNQVLTSPKSGLPLVLAYDFKRTFAQLRDDDVAKQFFADARDPGEIVRLMRTVNLLYS